jgi:hypothetical protein
MLCEKGESMENLKVYLHNFTLEELQKVRCLGEYHLEERKIDFEDRSNLEPDVPAIFIFRNPPNSTELWNYIRMVRARKMNAAFLLMITRQDFALLYGACQSGITAVLMEPASRHELEGQIERCLHRIDEVTQTLRDRALLEEYEYEKRQQITERLLANILEKPEEVEFMLPEINKRYDMKLGKHYYQAFVISVNTAIAYQSATLRRQMVQPAVKQIDIFHRHVAPGAYFPKLYQSHQQRVIVFSCARYHV